MFLCFLILFSCQEGQDLKRVKIIVHLKVIFWGAKGGTCPLSPSLGSAAGYHPLKFNPISLQFIHYLPLETLSFRQSSTLACNMWAAMAWTTSHAACYMHGKPWVATSRLKRRYLNRVINKIFNKRHISMVFVSSKDESQLENCMFFKYKEGYFAKYNSDWESYRNLMWKRWEGKKDT